MASFLCPSGSHSQSQPYPLQLAKEAIVRAYKDVKYSQPIQLAMDFADFLRVSFLGRPHVLDELPYVEALTLEQVRAYLKTELFRQADVEALVAGNMEREAAVGMVQEAMKKLRGGLGLAPAAPSEVPQTRAMMLPSGQGWDYRQDSPNPEEGNSATVVTFQVRGEWWVGFRIRGEWLVGGWVCRSAGRSVGRLVVCMVGQ